MVGRPCLGHPGGMSAEVIGYRERRVHRPFDGRSTSLAPAFAAIIIVDSGPARQTAPPDRASRTSHRVCRCSPRVSTRPDLRNVSAGQGT
ncbi:hypothetical protein C4J65_30755 [Streptomyces sp. CB09001]|nr:hypothetical protein C4J65_30755 [Streptomyces sp. CB09001]